MNYRIIPVTSFVQNSTLLYCKKTAVAAIVDPGGDIPLIETAVRDAGVSLEKILVTHAHIDHIGAVHELAEKYQLPIIGPHHADQFWIDALPQQSEMFGFPACKGFTPSRWLNHGDKISIGETILEVIHCPGHTPGHVIFYSPKDKLALVGDVIFAGSIGRTDFPQGNHDDLLHSIRERLLPLGDDVEFVPGHGPTSNFGEEKRTNPFI